MKQCRLSLFQSLSPLASPIAALPPLNRYFDLDEELVKKGKWKDSVSRSYELGGYQNFIPQSLQAKRESAEKEMKEAVEREQKMKADEEEEKVRSGEERSVPKTARAHTCYDRRSDSRR